MTSDTSYDRKGRKLWFRGKIYDELFWQDDLRPVRSMYNDPLKLRLWINDGPLHFFEALLENMYQQVLSFDECSGHVPLSHHMETPKGERIKLEK